MIVIPGQSQPLKAAGKRITSWVEESDALMVEVGSTVRHAACPRCSTRSSRLNGYYQRAIANSPSSGRPVRLAVEHCQLAGVGRGALKIKRDGLQVALGGDLSARHRFVLEHVHAYIESRQRELADIDVYLPAAMRPCA